MKRTQLFLLFTFIALSMIGFTSTVDAQGARRAAPRAEPISQSLPKVYLYWRKAMITKNYRAWDVITAAHRKQLIKNRILSEKGRFPADVFKLPGTPPSLAGLKLLRARSKGPTAKLVYFGKVDFGVGGKPSDNILLLNFLHEGRGWKYDSAEFINLGGLKDVRAQLKSGKLDYVDTKDFLPDGKRPIMPIQIGRVKYIAKVYTYCPGREVKVTVNKISKHRFQDITQSEVIIGGVNDAANQIQFQIKDLPVYKGSDPLTLRVYIFSQINGVKPIKVFQYQIQKGERPKASGSAFFNIRPEDGRKILRGR